MKRKSGFTLIEMLVVIGIVGLALPAIFAIIFAVVRQQARVFALKQVKREGDFVLNTVEFGLRNYASGIFTSNSLSTEVCDRAAASFPARYPSEGSDNGSNFYFSDNFNNWFRYYLTSTEIASQSSITANSPLKLTTSKIQITNFALSCSRAAAFSAPIISISFDVSYAPYTGFQSQFQEDTITLHYQTQVQMRTY